MVQIPLTLTCQYSARARVGDRFSLHVCAGGAAPKIIVRNLPLGLTTAGGSGELAIFGTPMVSGRSTAQVTARDKTRQVVKQVLVIDVQPRRLWPDQERLRRPGAITRPAGRMRTAARIASPVTIFPASGKVDQGSFARIRIGVLGALGANLSLRGSLPPGMWAQTAPGSAVLLGTPTGSGIYKITIVAERDMTTVTSIFTLTVRLRPPATTFLGTAAAENDILRPGRLTCRGQ